MSKAEEPGCAKAKAELTGSAAARPRVAVLCRIETLENSQTVRAALCRHRLPAARAPLWGPLAAAGGRCVREAGRGSSP